MMRGHVGCDLLIPVWWEKGTNDGYDFGHISIQIKNQGKYSNLEKAALKLSSIVMFQGNDLMQGLPSCRILFELGAAKRNARKQSQIKHFWVVPATQKTCMASVIDATSKKVFLKCVNSSPPKRTKVKEHFDLAVCVGLQMLDPILKSVSNPNKEQIDQVKEALVNLLRGPLSLRQCLNNDFKFTSQVINYKRETGNMIPWTTFSGELDSMVVNSTYDSAEEEEG